MDMMFLTPWEIKLLGLLLTQYFRELPLPVPHRPCSLISIDFLTDLTNSIDNHNGGEAIRFSKAFRLIPAPKLPTATQTAEQIFHNGMDTL